MFSFTADIPVLTSEDSNSIFISVFRGDLGNFQNLACASHRLSYHKGNFYHNIWPVVPLVLPEVKTDFFFFLKSIVQLMSLRALWISEGYSTVTANGRAGTRSKIQ